MIATPTGRAPMEGTAAGRHDAAMSLPTGALPSDPDLLTDPGMEGGAVAEADEAGEAAEGEAAAGIGPPADLDTDPATARPRAPDSLFAAHQPESAADLAVAAALRGRSTHINELLEPAPPGRPEPALPRLRPLWQRFFDVLGTPGWMDLEARMGRVQRRLREDGATYNVYAEGEERPRPWALELLPFLIGPDEWSRIERGVIQRARLLDAALADVYGPQQLLARGLLPAQLVYAHGQYLRPMQGVKPAGGRWLHVVGVDLARGPDGHWWVVGHRTQAPSGMGYLLENRLIIAQQFSAAFGALKVQRLASSFQALLEGLLRDSPLGERSRVALLTPGPHNETYFEHVFLARYLGLTLVEGSDLTVRDSKLYLKTLHGLERVHVLLRRVDDEWLDPLELRSDSQLGVPGLLQAVRAGELVLGNAPGAGLMESPGFSAFWPAVCRQLLGEDLRLPGATSWWCGETSVWHSQRERLADYVVAPSFPPGSPGAPPPLAGIHAGGAASPAFEPVRVAALSPAQQAQLRAAIDADPAAYTLLAPLRPSETPVWREGRLEACSAVVRVYAVADGAGAWRVLPGGMTRVDSRSGSNAGSSKGTSHGPGGLAAHVEGQGGHGGHVNHGGQTSFGSFIGHAASRATSAVVSSSASGGVGAVGARSSERADAYLSMQRGSASADTWVLTRGEVDPLSLLPKPLTPGDLAGWHRPITSRAAENLFWLGRYIERAEGSLRLARLTLEAIPAASPAVLGVLHSLAVRHGLVRWDLPSPRLPADLPPAEAAAALPRRIQQFERSLIQALAAGRDGRSPRTSLGFNLYALRQSAQALRERLSTEHWTLIDHVGDRFERRMDRLLRGSGSMAAGGGGEGALATPSASEVLEVLTGVGMELAAITGAQTDRMTRDDGWRLMSVGRMLERLDLLAHGLALGFEAGLPASDDGFALLLGLFDSTITYRAQFQARREVPPLLALLVLDTDNPRSLAWVARTMRDRFRKLARHHGDWAEAVAARLPTPEHWPLARLCATDAAAASPSPAGTTATAAVSATAAGGRHAELIRLLHEASAASLGLSEEISRQLFSHVLPADQQVWL
ncbi:MAG: hypothetical protein RL722_1740 [Pseudomonadota bacterium]